jgi:hypothetical protein
MNDDINPQAIMSQALQTQIDQRTMSGELRVQKQVAQQPATGGSTWDLPSFFDYLRNNKAVVPQFQGAAQPAGGWFDQASQAIGGTEGFESKAYHGVYSPLRKPGDIFVKPGEYQPGMKSEVSIGYGYNIAGNPDSENVFKDVLGIDKDRYTKIVNGQDGITPAEGMKLRDYMIYQANASLDRQIKQPLSDHQRAALVSMVYNFGPTGFARTGIPAAINAGADPQKVAQMIQAASPAQPKLKARRQAEAQLFLGVQGASQMLASTTSNYTK